MDAAGGIGTCSPGAGAGRGARARGAARAAREGVARGRVACSARAARARNLFATLIGVLVYTERISVHTATRK